ncbi:MAG: class I SAM-dependent methyltransferase [Candidatus Omnitrophota bacterium]
MPDRANQNIQQVYYDEMVDYYDQLYRKPDYHFQRVFNFFIKSLGIKEPGAVKMLEVGCGTGRYTINFLKMGFSIVGLDVSRKSLDVLERTSRESGLDRNLKICQLDIEKDDPNNGIKEKFDIVLCIHSLHHIKDFPSVVKRMAAMAKDKGTVACLEPNPWNPFLYPFLFLFLRRNWKIERGMLNCTEKKLKSAFRNAGLKNIRVFNYGLFPPLAVNLLHDLAKVEDMLSEAPILNKFLALHFISGEKQ